MQDYSNFFIKPTLSDPGTFYGSSGYSVSGAKLTTPAKPVTSAETLKTLQDYPVWGKIPTRLASVLTGEPWTGKDPWTGKYYKNGLESTEPVKIPGTDTVIDPNDPSQRYRAVDIMKSPEIATATGDLLASFKQNADAALKGFDDYFTTFKDQMGSALQKSNAATDIAPFEAATRGLQTRYSNDLNDISSRVEGTLNDAASRERGVLSRAEGLLPEYDLASQNVADRQMGALQQNLSRYKLSTGTPTSMGSDESRILARGASDIQLPVELSRIGRKYDLLNNMALPIERDVTGRNLNYFQNFQPMVSGQQYTSGTATEGAIQQLKMAVSTMSFDNALRYMQSLGVPAQIQQQILSGQIGQLGGLSQLEEGSRYRGLQDVLGVNVSQPVGYPMGMPPMPSYQPPSPATPARQNTVATPAAKPPIAGVEPNASGVPGYIVDAWNKIMGGGVPEPSRYPTPSRYAGTPLPDISQQDLDYASTLA